MRILSVDDVALKHADYVFRQSPATGRLAGFAFLGAAIAFGAAGLLGALPTVLAALTAGTLLLFAGIAAVTYRRSLGSGNWILAMHGPKLLIKLRSHLNPDTPTDRSSLVELEASDLVGVRVTRSTLTGDDSAGDPAGEETIYLDIMVRGSTRDIERALDAERSRRRDGATWGHYPVSVPAPDTVRLEWHGTYARILPEIDEAVRRLAVIAPLLETAGRHVDLGTSGRRPETADVEREIRLLAHQGRVIEATVLAVRGLGMGQTAAREYVGLITGTTSQRRLRDRH